MKNIKIIYNFMKQNFLKSFVIEVLIFFSVFACTFFLIPLVKQWRVNNVLKDMEIDSKTAFYSESGYITLYEANYETNKYEELINFFNNMEEIENFSTTYQIITKTPDFSTILYDIPLLKMMNNKVSQGNWINTENIDENMLPVIITDNLKNKYPLNSTLQIEAQGKNFIKDSNDIIKMNCKVVGILEKDSYIYMGGSSHSDMGISDSFYHINNNSSIVIVPNIFQDKIRYFANSGAVVHYADNTNVDYINKELQDKGIGKIYNMKQLKDNDLDNLLSFNEQQIYEFFIILCFIVVSIGGYNTLATLNYRRLLTIYYLNGLTIKRAIFYITIKNILQIIIPTLISSIISNNIILNIKSLYDFDIRVIFITLLIYIIPVVITVITTINSLKKIRPIQVLREEI